MWNLVLERKPLLAHLVLLFLVVAPESVPLPYGAVAEARDGEAVVMGRGTTVAVLTTTTTFEAELTLSPALSVGAGPVTSLIGAEMTDPEESEAGVGTAVSVTVTVESATVTVTGTQAAAPVPARPEASATTFPNTVAVEETA